MKIVILGAGAMGCLYGGHLAKDNEVWLLDVWKGHVDEINRKGLLIEGISGDRVVKNIKATTNAADIGVADVVFVFVKSTITDLAIIQNKCIFGNNTIVLTLQNGLGNIDKINQSIDSKNILAGVTSHGATMLSPGKIYHAGIGTTHIGELDGLVTKRVESIAHILRTAGLETLISENVSGLIWGKLLVNVGINALTAITGFKNGELIQNKETEELLALAVEEAWNIAKANNIVLSYDDPIYHTKQVCKSTAENRSSMLQDVSNKRKTEIDMINGAIVREGKRIGVPTPVNTVLTNLIKAIENNY